MSSTGTEVADACCASCGIAEGDDMKLKKCGACKSVRYCSIECQRDHRPQHKRACKKRAEEIIRDEILFKQPESSHLGDCPICFLPLPLDAKKSTMTMMACCSKIICDGCEYANRIRVIEGSLENKCAFCRHPKPETQAEEDANEMKRVKANDPDAIRQLGAKCYHKGDYGGAFEYYARAARLGNVEAHFNLANMYNDGEGVEKDEKKELYHLEEAAIGGHPGARHNLGCLEWRKGRVGRAVKHFLIASNLGYDKPIEMLKKLYVAGVVTKEDFAVALRAHQAAVDATKSPQREGAAKVWAKVRTRYS